MNTPREPSAAGYYLWRAERPQDERVPFFRQKASLEARPRLEFRRASARRSEMDRRRERHLEIWSECAQMRSLLLLVQAETRDRSECRFRTKCAGSAGGRCRSDVRQQTFRD